MLDGVSQEERDDLEDLIGVSRLAIDAKPRVTEVVEAMHNTIAAGLEVYEKLRDGLGTPTVRPVEVKSQHATPEVTHRIY